MQVTRRSTLFRVFHSLSSFVRIRHCIICNTDGESHDRLAIGETKPW